MFRGCLLLATPLVLLFCPVATAQAVEREDESIRLPEPVEEGGKTLFEALRLRRSSRQFSERPLPLQTLSNLLWAAYGINRAENGNRTAPSAHNSQETDIYVITAEAVYLYDAKLHLLKVLRPGDWRSSAGTQDYVEKAAINLIYVADLAKIESESEAQKIFYAAADTGFIGQNVYLFCASQGLNTVIRASVSRDELSRTLGLRPDQRITLAQSVGYPAQ